MGPLVETIALHGRLDKSWDAEPAVVRLTKNADVPDPHRHALLASQETPASDNGFNAILCARHSTPEVVNGAVRLPPELAYLDEGDVVRLNPRRGELSVIYRRTSKTNSLLLTERCNSWCVMCSQPPKNRDDSYLAEALLEAIPLISPEAEEIGFTGGEPTILGGQFLALVEACKVYLPNTSLHVLSNGRSFNYLTFAQDFSSVAPTDTMLGVPLYSDLAWHHDYVVQSPGAFDQTIRGILNLARCQVAVEIRVVLQSSTVSRLPQLARFIARNLPFVQQVALMGYEPIGFGKANSEVLWIDPLDCHAELSKAVEILDAARIPVLLFNHQLCTIPLDLWKYSCQSISDWKNIYLSKCHGCEVQDLCGGFFHSATETHSRGIQPVEIDVKSRAVVESLRSRMSEDIQFN